MNDFTHIMPESFKLLRESWQGDGGIIPYTCNYGSVDVEELDNTVIYIGRVNGKTLILHVEQIVVEQYCKDEM